MEIIDWISFGLLVAVVGLLTLKGQSSIRNTETYFVATKRTGLFALVATLVMTELNTSTLVGFASLGYIFGSSAVSLSLVFLIGLLFYAVVVAKKWKNFNAISVTTFFDQRYNKVIGLIAKIILTVAMIGFSANYIKSLTLIFLPVFPQSNSWIISAVFCVIMAMMTIRGGLKSIIQIDILSFMITLIMFPFLYFMSFFSSGTGTANITFVAKSAQGALPIPMLISLIIITMFTYILAPWYGQKIFTANSTKTAFKAVIYAAIIISIIYALTILSASNLLKNTNIHLQAQEAIPYLIQFNLPYVFHGIAYAMLFFIAATTIVGLWNTIASVFIAHRLEGIDKIPLYYSILITLAIAVVSYWLSNVFIDQIFDKMVLMNIPISALAFSLLAGFYWQKTSSMASFLSILSGVLGGVFCYYYFGEANYLWYWAVYSIPLSFVVGVISTLVTTTSVKKLIFLQRVL